MGWYRMHQTVFTCSHIGQEELYRVHWLRYHINEITERATHRKIRRRCQSFRVAIETFSETTVEHALLHARYRSNIDFDGALSIQECLFGNYETARNIFNTKRISIYDGEQLIAGGYFDVGDISAASILHFFHPDYARYSLGKYLILLTLDCLKQHGFELYYPGYVVQGLPKMNYKLFLGQQQAQYFDPETRGWKYFEDKIVN